MKIIIKKQTIIIIIIILSQQVFGQEKSTESELGIMEALNEAKTELKGTDIGQKFELWYNSLKAKNIKLKLLFDEEGFDIMLKMISLGNRLFHENALLDNSDVFNILSFISAAEKLGCEAPAGLKEKINIRLPLAIGKNWREGIKLLKTE